MGLVTGAATGAVWIYALYDNHVAMLLDEAVYHIEHLGLGVPMNLPRPPEGPWLFRCGFRSCRICWVRRLVKRSGCRARESRRSATI